MLQNRIFGLDLMRSTALVIVLLIHSEFFLRRNFNTEFIRFLPDGVEMFFVLSGFLIGRLLIKTFVEDRDANLRSVINFLQRRWFRTLPNYYLFLLVNVVLIYFQQIPGTLNKYFITYPFFLQNFHKPYDFLFWESWSLSVEEWFYLFFPFTLLGSMMLYKQLQRKYKFLLVIFLFLLAGTFLRCVNYSEALNYDLYYRKLVLMRLDSCVYGVLMAYLFHFHYRLFSIKWINFLLLLTGVSGFFYLNRIIEGDFYSKTFYFNVQGVFLSLWIPFLAQWESTTISSNAVKYLSLMSFVIYLTHLPLIHILNNYLPPVSDSVLILYYSGYWVLNLLLGHFIFSYFERPMMLKREYWTNYLFKQGN